MTDRILRRREVEARTGLSKSSIYTKTDPNSPYFDDSFPRPIKLGLRAVGWSEHSISAWLQTRVTAAE
jgi:prophage regulatory protein